MGSFFGLIGLCIVPETYAPLLLSRRASSLRHETKNWAIHSQHDEKRLDFNAILNTYLLLPLKMLIQETILFLVALYLSLVYSVLYLSLEAYPISFQEVRGWTGGVGSLPFLSLLVGFTIGGVIIVIQNYGGYARQIREKGHAPPEARLPPMMIGAVAFPIGLFVGILLNGSTWTRNADLNVAVVWLDLLSPYDLGSSGSSRSTNRDWLHVDIHARAQLHR
jgi:hypothetical protein